jgi:glycosyltransferase involved in cell wall biosynthesis
MVGGTSPDVALEHKIQQEAANLKNITYLGPQSFEKVEQLFDQSTLYVNTSPREGFPNTFLQAWCRGIPVVSFFDPDGLIERNKLGITVKSFTEMKEAVEFLSSNPEHSMIDTSRIQDYFVRKLSTTNCINTFIQILLDQ